jgi:16S rRNA (uracil1498-N3)-methyltransferase
VLAHEAGSGVCAIDRRRYTKAMIRLYVPYALDADAMIAPVADQARYLLTVMRLKAGDPILLFNGRDGEWRCVVAEVSKRGCLLKIQSKVRPQASPPDLDLIVAVVKRGPLEAIVEKATELGARRLRLMLTRRTNAPSINIARLQAIAVEAAEQTGRLDVPEIAPPQKLDAVLAGWPDERRLMFCDEAGDDPEAEWGGMGGRAATAGLALQNAAQHKVQQNVSGSSPWAVMIGPEGGFTTEERANLRGRSFVVPVSLGPRILRADTAAIAALTLWQAALGVEPCTPSEFT